MEKLCPTEQNCTGCRGGPGFCSGVKRNEIQKSINMLINYRCNNALEKEVNSLSIFISDVNYRNAAYNFVFVLISINQQGTAVGKRLVH